MGGKLAGTGKGSESKGQSQVGDLREGKAYE
jgi:hypothetical protein